ncbi:MAG: tandem-95 repeat protein, partial [Chloroflexi bacterium]|nr:tandem-95 repeat protein [Chloroflexota bacterium]
PQVYTFTVKVCDDATPSLCDQQSVKLTVTEVNRAPEIEDIEDQEVTVGEELTFTAVASDPDLPANTLTFRLEEAPAGAAIDPTTGKFTWTPVESQIGEHEFYVCVTDGQLNTCTLVKVTVKQGHVNTPPVAVADTYAVDQDQVLTIAAPGVLANDTDADNDTLTAILVSTTSNGTLTFKADGSFVYTPRAGYFGTDTFTYKANDGKADSNVVTVTITVRKVEPVMPYQMYYPVIFQGW